MDRGAWWATVHWVIRSKTRLKRLGMHARRRILSDRTIKKRTRHTKFGGRHSWWGWEGHTAGCSVPAKVLLKLVSFYCNI